MGILRNEWLFRNEREREQASERERKSSHSVCSDNFCESCAIISVPVYLCVCLQDRTVISNLHCHLDRVLNHLRELVTSGNACSCFQGGLTGKDIPILSVGCTLLRGGVLGWRDDSVIKSTDCSTSLGFNYQHTYVTTVCNSSSSNLEPSHQHTCKKGANVQKNKNKVFFLKIHKTARKKYISISPSNPITTGL